MKRELIPSIVLLFGLGLDAFPAAAVTTVGPFHWSVGRASPVGFSEGSAQATAFEKGRARPVTLPMGIVEVGS